MACIIALQAFMICVGSNHHRAHACVVVNFQQRRVQFGDQSLRQAVAGFGPVQREHGDAAERFAQQIRRLRRGGAGGLSLHRNIHLGGSVILM
jgi:hypothetical protein